MIIMKNIEKIAFTAVIAGIGILMIYLSLIFWGVLIVLFAALFLIFFGTEEKSELVKQFRQSKERADATERGYVRARARKSASDKVKEDRRRRIRNYYKRGGPTGDPLGYNQRKKK